MREPTNHPLLKADSPVIEAFDTILYDTKGAVNLFWSFISKEQAYLVVLSPWKDKTPPLTYYEMHSTGVLLPKNVKVYVSPDPKYLSEQIKLYKVIKPKYIRKRRRKNPTTDTTNTNTTL